MLYASIRIRSSTCSFAVSTYILCAVIRSSVRSVSLPLPSLASFIRNILQSAVVSDTVRFRHLPQIPSHSCQPPESESVSNVRPAWTVLWEPSSSCTNQSYLGTSGSPSSAARRSKSVVHQMHTSSAVHRNQFHSRSVPENSNPCASINCGLTISSVR